MSAMDEAFPCVTRLKETIHYLGKSVEAVASDLGISTRNMYNYVNGKVVVPENLRPKFAAYLHSEEAFLFPHPSLWLTAAVKQNLPESPIQEEEIVKRRDFIALGARAMALPAIASDTALKFAHTLAIETAYPRWVTIMETCWQLYFTGGIPVIEMCLPNVLSEPTAAACQSSGLQKQIMALASQAYQMDWLLALQRQDFGQALVAIDQAYLYGKEAQDANLELASLVRKAHVYFHVKNPVKQLSIHEQAAQYVHSVSPLLRGWFYLLLAENHASLRHDKDAATFLDLAHEILLDHSTQDETFSYVQMNTYLISNFEIICQLHLNQPRKSLATLEQLGLSDTDPRCAELSNHRLTALYLLNEMDELCCQFAPSVQVARQTKSNLRYHELCRIYSNMITRWPAEQKIRELEMFLYA